MEQPFTANQLTALRACPTTTPQLIANHKTADGYPFTVDQARNLFARLEKRQCVAGDDGIGQQRVWSLTDKGAAVLAAEGIEISGTSNGQKTEPQSEREATRPYIVLDELSLRSIVEEVLGDMDETMGALITDHALAAMEDVTIYERAADVPARNTEHALRQAGKLAYPGVPEAKPHMVAIADRHFQVEEVVVRNNQSVSIGGRK